MTIIRAEQPLTYPERHDHQHAGRVAWWLRGPESWGCVFERGPAAEPAPGVDSAGAKPESLEFSDSCPDKTHFPTRTPDYFTYREGDDWVVWGSEAPWDPVVLRFRSPLTVPIDKFRCVHSLLWVNFKTGEREARWDCINGFTELWGCSVPS